MRKVWLLGPSVGWNAVSLTIENSLPSIARWKVSAIRAPTPFRLPALNYLIPALARALSQGNVEVRRFRF